MKAEIDPYKSLPTDRYQSLSRRSPMILDRLQKNRASITFVNTPDLSSDEGAS